MSHIAAAFIRNHKEPKIHFLISKMTFLVMAQISFQWGSTVRHWYKLLLENVKSGFRLSSGRVLEG